MWNYRILRDKNDTLIVAEVYYDDNKQPYGSCDISLIGDDIPDLKEQVNMLNKALEQPILDEESIHRASKKVRKRDVESTL